MNNNPRQQRPAPYITHLYNIPTPWPLKYSEALTYLLIMCALAAAGIWVGIQIAGSLTPGWRIIPIILGMLALMYPYERYFRSHPPADIDQRRTQATAQATAEHNPPKDADK